MGCGSSNSAQILDNQLKPSTGIHHECRTSLNPSSSSPHHDDKYNGGKSNESINELISGTDQKTKMFCAPEIKEDGSKFEKGGSFLKEDSSAEKVRSTSETDLRAGNMTKENEKPKKAPVKEQMPEEIIECLTATITRLKEASDFLTEESASDFFYLNKRFSSITHSEDRKINLCSLELGVVELCMKVLRESFEKDFLGPEGDTLWNVLKRALVILWNGSDRYKEICERLLKIEAHLFLLEVVQHPKIAEESNDVKMGTRQIYIIKGVFGVIHNMLMHLGEAGRTTFRQLGTVEILKSQLQSRNIMIKVKAFINLAYLINEEENEIINAGDKHIRFIVSMLKEAVSAKNRRSKRGFSAIETIEALNKLAVNDNNKERIHNSGALDYYEKLLVDGVTEDEQRTIVHGIWTLSFHPKCREAVNNMPVLMENLTELGASENAKVKKVAKGALFVLEGDHSHKETTTDTAGFSRDVQHVMISYNWDVKPIALQIRDRLNEAGYKVWMDVDNMTGSTLEAMAEAVEKAAVVLMCMTHKYKESPSCRTEAEYTYQLRKPFIPLRLQAKYKADGWLGIMTGTRLWFDFIKDFPSAMGGLIKELGTRGKINASAEIPMIQAQQVDQVGSAKQSLGTNRSNYASWSEDQVIKWMKENGLGHQVSKLSSLNGGLLGEFVEMRRDAPESFYSCLRDDLRFTLIDILKFTKALGKL